MSVASKLLRAMVLEDELADQILISSALHDTNVVVEGHYRALNGLLGALRDQGEEPDVVLVDLNVPDSQGLNTVEVLRSAHPTIPIVVITGDRMAAAGALRAGADGVVEKTHLADRLGPAIMESRERNDGISGARIRGFYMADAPLMVVDRADEIVLANAAAQALLDRPPEVGRPFSLLFVPEDRVEVMSFLGSLYGSDGGRVWCVARLVVPLGVRECVLTGVYDKAADTAHITMRPSH